MRWDRIFCPMCGDYAVASLFGRRDGRPVTLDGHWCKTEGCPHNIDGGTGWGRDIERDYSGERGPVPGTWRAHDWRTCRVMRELGDAWAFRIWGLSGRERIVRSMSGVDGALGGELDGHGGATGRRSAGAGRDGAANHVRPRCAGGSAS